MDSVLFISTEIGDDLIVSFAVQDPQDPGAVESLTLLRTPKYEFLLEERERGVHVSFERYDCGEDYDCLEEVRFAEKEGCVHLKTESRRYELDVRTVLGNEITAMREVLRAMNFDGRIRLSGL